ncbi:hypothetical protein Tco_1134309, partial [Tanacetum coccineum]
ESSEIDAMCCDQVDYANRNAKTLDLRSSSNEARAPDAQLFS